MELNGVSGHGSKQDSSENISETKIAKNNAVFSESAYWDERFGTEMDFEWLADFDKLKHSLRPYIRPEHRLVHLGCGSSSLSCCIRDELHCTHILNVDYSLTLVQRMQLMQPEFTWLCADIRDLSAIQTASVDVVLEKATLDSLLTVETDLWHRSATLKHSIDRCVSEISRILKPNGHFLSITFEQPHFRLPLYAQDKYKWSVQVQSINNASDATLCIYMYVMQKGAPLQQDALDVFMYACNSAPIIQLKQGVPYLQQEDSPDGNWINSIHLDFVE